MNSASNKALGWGLPIVLCLALLIIWLQLRGGQAEHFRGPLISFEETTYDAGEFQRMPKDMTIRKRFRFENVGTEELHIEKVSTTCGCTSASSDRNRYAVGEKGYISVELTLPPMGRRDEAIYVRSNAKGAPMKLRITGGFMPRWRVSCFPPTLEIGSAVEPEGSSVRVFAFSRDDEEIEISRAYTLSGRGDVTTRTMVRPKGYRNVEGYYKTVFEVTVSPTNEKAVSVAEDELVVDFSKADTSDLKIPLCWRQPDEGSLRASPEKVMLVFARDGLPNRAVRIHGVMPALCGNVGIVNPLSDWLEVTVLYEESPDVKVLFAAQEKPEASLDGNIHLAFSWREKEAKEIDIPVRALVLTDDSDR